MTEVKISDALVKIANEAQQDFFDAHKLSEFFCSGHYHEESMRAALEASIPHLHPQPAELAEQQGEILTRPARVGGRDFNAGALVQQVGGRAHAEYDRFHNRDPRDVASDPEGILIHDPADPLFAATGKQQVGEVLTDTYVQTVPDKCDRIVWRAHYYHLPIKQAGEVQANQVQPVAHSDSQWIK